MNYLWNLLIKYSKILHQNVLLYLPIVFNFMQMCCKHLINYSQILYGILLKHLPKLFDIIQIIIMGFVNCSEIFCMYFVGLVTTSVYYFVQMCKKNALPFFGGLLTFFWDFLCGFFTVVCDFLCRFFTVVWNFLCGFFTVVWNFCAVSSLMTFFEIFYSFLKIFIKYINDEPSYVAYLVMLCYWLSILIFIYLFRLICLLIMDFYATGEHIVLI